MTDADTGGRTTTHSDVRRIARNSVYQTIAYAAKALALFVVYLCLARAGGAERLGDFATIITLVSLLNFVAAFGLPDLLTREIARLREDPRQVGRLVNASIGLVVLMSLAAAPVLAAAGWLLGYSGAGVAALALAGLALACEAMGNVVAASFRGVEEMQWSSLVSIAMDAGFLVLALPVIAFSPTMTWLMAAYAASRLAALVVAARLYVPRFGSLRAVRDHVLWRTLASGSFPFAATSVLSLVYVRIDVLFLSYLSGSATVGLYEAATSLAVRVNVLAYIVNLSLYPFLSYRFAQDRRSLRIYTARAIHQLLIPGFLAAVVFWAFSREIIALLYGEEFLGATGALRYFALITPLRMIGHSLAIALRASDRQGQSTIAVAVAALLNVALNVLLIPRYHMMGAVVATILTEVALFGTLLWYLRHEIAEMIRWRAFAAPLAGTLSVLAAAWLLDGVMNGYVLMAACLLLYAAIIVRLDRSSLTPLLEMMRRKPA